MYDGRADMQHVAQHLASSVAGPGVHTCSAVPFEVILDMRMTFHSCWCLPGSLEAAADTTDTQDQEARARLLPQGRQEGVRQSARVRRPRAARFRKPARLCACRPLPAGAASTRYPRRSSRAGRRARPWPQGIARVSAGAAGRGGQRGGGVWQRQVVGLEARRGGRLRRAALERVWYVEAAAQQRLRPPGLHAPPRAPNLSALLQPEAEVLNN